MYTPLEAPSDAVCSEVWFLGRSERMKSVSALGHSLILGEGVDIADLIQLVGTSSHMLLM
jgi:hypothetical protein